MKQLIIVTLLISLTGCATQSDYYKAVLAVEVARADAENAKWKAVEVGMSKATAEGAGMAALAIGLGKGAGEAQRVQITPPRDGWDYFIQGVQAFGTLTQAVGGVIVPVRLAQEARKGNEAMYASNALIEASRGATQTAINGQTVGALAGLGIAAANATRGAVTTTTNNTATTNTLSGTGVLGNGTYTGPVTTTTSTTNSYNPANPTPRVCSTTATGVLNCQGG